MHTFGLEEVKGLAQGYKAVPIARGINTNGLSPIDVLKRLKKASRQCYILDSMEDAQNWGRYTFLGYAPKLEITCQSGEVCITSGTRVQIQTDKPGAYINNIIAENKSPRIEGLPTFTGGLVGYFSYEYLQYAEPTLKLGNTGKDFKDFDLMLFDKVIAFDNAEKQIILIANVHTDGLEENYAKALHELDAMERIIRQGEPADIPTLKLTSAFTSRFSEAEYCTMVERAKEHIREGDIFQVVLSNLQQADAEGCLLDTYRVLRLTNPSPYMFFFSSDNVEIAGASPETLVKLEDGRLTTFPLAGTRPRGKTPEEDAQLERELLADEKELAEHNMLVDLGRNDLGKVSEFGSVEVEEYQSIERFSHVMHIGSTVRGRLREDKNALDAIEAVLPAGTLSGAPKIRACQIIDELEQGTPRGIYGGAIGYLDFSGNMDTCIAIRLVYKKQGKVYVRSGAGIVADSVPEKEYAECQSKAQAVVNALEFAQGGIE